MPLHWRHITILLAAATVLAWQAPYVLGALIAPRRTGARLAVVPVWTAILVHFACVVAAWCILLLAGELVSRVRLPGGDGQFIRLFRMLANELLSTTSTRLRGVGPIASLGVLVALGEAYYWSLGIVTLGGWSGANLRPMRQAGRAAVVAGYASVWLIVLAAGWGLAGLLMRLSEMPRIGVGAEDLLFWNAACVSGACLLTAVAPACVLGMSLRLASGMGDRIGRPPPAEDRLCETCGYNLHATGFDQRCPECGQLTSISLSGVRRSPDWEASLRSFLRTLVNFLFLPSRFFRQMPVRSGIDPARRFLAYSAVLSAIPFAVGSGLSLITRYGTRLGWESLETGWLHGLYVAILAAGAWGTGVIVLSMAAASVVAGASRRRHDRLGTYGAAKVACYMAGLAVPWSLLVALMSVGTEYLRELLRPVGGLNGTTYTLSWMVVAMLLLVWYWIVGSRAYEATQFANS